MYLVSGSMGNTPNRSVRVIKNKRAALNRKERNHDVSIIFYDLFSSYHLRPTDRTLRKALSSIVSISIDDPLKQTGLLARLLGLPIVYFTKGEVHSFSSLDCSRGSHMLVIIRSIALTVPVLRDLFSHPS